MVEPTPPCWWYTHVCHECVALREIQSQRTVVEDDPIIDSPELGLDPITEEEVPDSTRSFDGLSCTAFKLNQLKQGAQAQRIAAFLEKKADADALDSKENNGDVL